MLGPIPSGSLIFCHGHWPMKKVKCFLWNITILHCCSNLLEGNQLHSIQMLYWSIHDVPTLKIHIFRHFVMEITQQIQQLAWHVQILVTSTRGVHPSSQCECVPTSTPDDGGSARAAWETWPWKFKAISKFRRPKIHSESYCGPLKNPSTSIVNSIKEKTLRSIIMNI